MAGATAEQLTELADKVRDALLRQVGQKVEVCLERGMVEVDRDGWLWVRHEPLSHSWRLTITINDAVGIDVPLKA